MRIALASDHAGFDQKPAIKAYCESLGHEVIDFGPDTQMRVDYPDFAHLVAHAVAKGQADRGILICGTGIGMALTADKVPGVRAAVIQTPEFSHLFREHNNGNVLCISGRFTPLEVNKHIVDEFLTTEFAGGRHTARVEKIMREDEAAALEETAQHTPSLCSGTDYAQVNPYPHLHAQDEQVEKAIFDELERERNSIELIASENFVSYAVLEAVGSPLTNKYAEGLPGKRYYGGCWAVDEVEELARERAKKLFGAAYANVQPHAGAQANYAAQAALLKPGDTILGMSLTNGGHLTHGSPANYSGKLYNCVFYGLDPKTELIDYDEVERLAKEVKPQLIIAGASVYSRVIDFERFAAIAHEVGAYLMVDMAHIAGLVATGMHPNPVPYADVVTTTTHKTLRGPRGGLILCNDQNLAKKINSSVFPGTQGGPLEHVIAGKAVAFGEALQPSFVTYAQQIVENARALGEGLASQGLRLVSGGTDNHLLLVDLTPLGGLTGADAEKILEDAGITVNKNTIPNETRSVHVTSGIRVGSAAITTRGFTREEAHEVGTLIGELLNGPTSSAVQSKAKAKVAQLLKAHPLYPEL